MEEQRSRPRAPLPLAGSATRSHPGRERVLDRLGAGSVGRRDVRGLGPLQGRSSSLPGTVMRSAVTVHGRRYERVVIRTHWIQPGEDIGRVVERYIAPHRREGDCLFISEKAVVVARGEIIPAPSVKPRRAARLLTRWVRSHQGVARAEHPGQDAARHRGRGPPADPVGHGGGRADAALRLARRLLCRRRLPGQRMDGMRPPFEEVLIPPIAPSVARAIAAQIAGQLGMPVAITDLSDRGGLIRAVSGPELRMRSVRDVLRDNPLRQRDHRTPIGLLRPWPR